MVADVLRGKIEQGAFGQSGPGLPGDANADNVYEVEIRADDGQGLSTTDTVLVTVTPENDNAPAFTSGAAELVVENTVSVQVITATDADLPAQVITFSNNASSGFVDSLGSRLQGSQKMNAELTVRQGEIVWDLNGLSAKPLDLDEYFSVVRSIEDFWLTTARLPSASRTWPTRRAAASKCASPIPLPTRTSLSRRC